MKMRKTWNYFYIPAQKINLFFIYQRLISRLRRRIREIVHNHVYQIVIITLVLLDAAIVVATILVDDSSKEGTVGYYSIQFIYL